MTNEQPDNTYASQLRVDLMDAPSRQRLRNFLQARLVSYHEDEFGQPTFAPNLRSFRVATPTPAVNLRRPARGLVALHSSPDTPGERGLRAILEISAEGDLTLWGGENFGVELLKAALRSISIQFSADPVQSDMFAMSVARNRDDVQVPAIWCCVRDRSKWLNVFRRRGVVASPLPPRED